MLSVMASSLPSPSQPHPRRQEERPPAPPSLSLFSSVRDRWRAYSSSSGKTTGNATSSSPSKSPPNRNLDSAASPGTNAKPATHLCVLVHGLWGRPSDWDVVAERLEEHKQRLERASEPPSSSSSSSSPLQQQQQQQQENLKVLKSSVNARRLTLDGIDVCARRLAEEVRAAVAEERKKFGAEAKLERVSFVGHSMGGLIARAAVAELLDDADAGGGNDGAKGKPTLAGGLSPAHFVSVATPHLGCHAEAEATTAFVAATKKAAAAAASAAAAAAAEEEKKKKRDDEKEHPALVPLVTWIASAAASAPGSASASAVAPRLLAAAAARASASMGRSGPQFFLADGGGRGGEGEGEGGPKEKSSALPLLARLADPSLPALRGLAAFESRTAFANSSGDHLVGWSNASLRDPRELPREELRAAAAKAAKAAEAAKAAAAGSNSGDAEPGAATGGGGWRIGLPFFFHSSRRGAAVTAAAAAREGGTGVVLDDGVAAAFEHQSGKGKEEGEKRKQNKDDADLADRMLSSLAALPWRRVDACFQGSPTPFLAHNHIQATHFFNEKVGRASADAIARAVVEADEELLRRRKERWGK